MKRSIAIIFLLTFVVVPATQAQQDKEVARLRTRQLLGQLLTKVGPDIKIAFRQSDKQPFNYLGVLQQGLTHSDSFEIVASVNITNTIGLRVFPIYKGNYINVDKARNPLSLMKQLLRLSDNAFLFWGIDRTGDVFTGYSFTLESGFPEDAIRTVLKSIVNSDRFVGELRPAIDGGVVP
jgi:hypothetical protein